MRRLTIVVLALAAIYSGYWVIGARAVSNGVSSAIAQMQADGWQVDIDDTKTRGFPSRFDTTFGQLTLAPPDRTWRYTAPFVQALALSYSPNEVIAVLPESQTLDLPGQMLTVEAESLRASTGVAASTDLAYQGFTAEGDAINIASTLNYTIAIPRLLAAMRPSAAGDTSYDFYTELLDLTLSGSNVSETIEQVSVDAVLSLDKALNRQTFQALDQDPVLPTSLAFKSIKLLWGEVQLNGSGDLDILTGTPEGRLDLAITNWQILLDRLVQGGAIDADVAATYSNLAGIMSGSDGTITMPLDFKNGSVFIGPLPVGPAPRFY